ncbi:hypothetical protein F5J12DRAFT_435761 [Pisolithus orientalis]|uniref:uncharacterized protein n=1 Tax=Pisolithus orientalis TaxID=936130 RepID=UPI002224001A|nr:uncharacterized protein F5J12DRAFT_435761 [Pisolithus orientalis]KAI5992583.1 hypothetical protein F5J12DRAFT_435761 [Pisolithus orientalis]
MYPHHPHVFLHRPASRIFWFLIGAGVATWWHHSRVMRDHHSQYWPCVVQQQRRGALQDQPTGGSEPPIAYQERDARWGWRHNPSSPGATVGWNQQEWEENKERLRNIQKRVSEAMVDMSESTLESIVSTAEALKARLAENRARREGAFPPETTEQKKDPSPSV